MTDPSSQVVLSAIVQDASSMAAPAGTRTTFRVIGQGFFQDTLTIMNVVNSAVESPDAMGDHLFDSGSAAGVQWLRRRR